jgi:phospholipid/cholesterol/gamma-HCH transport system substrate-binding protein
MKINNETKIGALAAVSITLLILGFNFLKGKNLLEKRSKIYAVFKKVQGIEVSNSVQINGYQIGTIADMQASDKDLNGIVLTINLTKDVHIPKTSIAYIKSGLIASSSIEIEKGSGTDYIGDGDTINTVQRPDIFNQVQSRLDPTIGVLNKTLYSLDSLIVVVGSLFDPKTKNNFASLLTNITASSASLQSLLNAQTGALAQSLNNVKEFTGNLAKNNEHLTKTLENAETVSAKLANAKIEETLTSVQSTMNELKGVVSKINNGSGSLGLLINDKKMYQNLENSTRSLNILLDDLRAHPKRYLSISVFGKKDKTGPLMAPLNDSSGKSGNQ